MAKAIVIAVSDGYGGYGDFLFALKLSQALKKQYSDNGLEVPPVYLVTQETGREQIRRLKGDTEFDVEVLTPDELKSRVEATDEATKIDVGAVIEGPVFDSFLIDHVEDALGSVGPAVPLLMVAEYGFSDNLKLSRLFERYRKSAKFSHLQHQKLIYSGLNLKERGILISEALANLAMTPAFYAAQLDDKIRDLLFGEGTLPNDSDVLRYQSNTEFSMQYSHDTLRDESWSHHTPKTYKTHASSHFLDAHRAFISTSTKNQDVLMVGKSKLDKLEDLREIKEKLIADGFTRISFYNADEKTEEILYDAGEDASPKKAYRVIYTASLSHPSMLAATALSGPFTGATGDQSFSEVISAGKIMFYECLTHKEALIASYDAAILRELSSDDDAAIKGKISEMLTLLRRAGRLGPEQLTHLGELMRDPLVQRRWMEANKAVIQKANLGATVFEEIILLRYEKKMIADLIRIGRQKEALALFNTKAPEGATIFDEVDGKSLLQHAKDIDPAGDFAQFFEENKDAYLLQLIQAKKQDLAWEVIQRRDIKTSYRLNDEDILEIIKSAGCVELEANIRTKEHLPFPDVVAESTQTLRNQLREMRDDDADPPEDTSRPSA